MGCRGRGYFLFPCFSNGETSRFQGFLSLGVFRHGQGHHSPLPAIKSGQRKLGEVDRIPTLIDRQQAHAFAPQHLTQKYIVPLLPAKVSMRMHAAKRHDVFLSEVLWGERVGLLPIDERWYTVYFAQLPLARFDSWQRRVVPLS